MLGIDKAYHFSKGFDGSKSLIAGFGGIFPLLLKFIEERDNELPCDVLQSEGIDFDSVILCYEWKKKSEGIAIGSDGQGTHPLYVREIVIEELMDAGGELHTFHSCQMVKS